MSRPSEQLFIDRLKTGYHFRFIGNRSDMFAMLASEEIITPSVFVILTSIEAAEFATPSPSIHQASAIFSIVYLIPNYSTGSQEGDDALLAATTTVENLLLGWKPTGFGNRVSYASGVMLSALDSNLLIWQDDFSLVYTIDT